MKRVLDELSFVVSIPLLSGIFKVCQIAADCIANSIRGGLTGARKIFSEGDL